MANINKEVAALFEEQISNWELARINFEGLKTVKSKTFEFNDFDIKVQFNPSRLISSGAKVDSKSISERKCFLCAENRPAEQKSIDFGNYSVLVNPFPIFPEHFTITHKEHIAQQISPYFNDMLSMAEAMDNYVIFYNGPQCGASAPDHLHFQAGTKYFLPLITDYKRLKDSHTSLLVTTEKSSLYQMTHYLRTVYCIEATDMASANDAFNKLYAYFQSDDQVEPLMNIVCMFENNKWYVFVLPRKAFRPWQYTAEADKQLLISPATVEMSGVFVSPIENHFNKITKKDIESIFEQISY